MLTCASFHRAAASLRRSVRSLSFRYCSDLLLKLPPVGRRHCVLIMHGHCLYRSRRVLDSGTPCCSLFALGSAGPHTFGRRISPRAAQTKRFISLQSLPLALLLVSPRAPSSCSAVLMPCSHTPVTKFALFLYCFSIRSKNSQVRVLWEDHRNDLFINGFVSARRDSSSLFYS
jgi:hypothetical protein